MMTPEMPAAIGKSKTLGIENQIPPDTGKCRQQGESMELRTDSVFQQGDALGCPAYRW